MGGDKKDEKSKEEAVRIHWSTDPVHASLHSYYKLATFWTTTRTSKLRLRKPVPVPRQAWRTAILLATTETEARWRLKTER